MGAGPCDDVAAGPSRMPVAGDLALAGGEGTPGPGARSRPERAAPRGRGLRWGPAAQAPRTSGAFLRCARGQVEKVPGEVPLGRDGAGGDACRRTPTADTGRESVRRAWRWPRGRGWGGDESRGPVRKPLGPVPRETPGSAASRRPSERTGLGGPSKAPTLPRPRGDGLQPPGWWLRARLC